MLIPRIFTDAMLFGTRWLFCFIAVGVFLVCMPFLFADPLAAGNPEIIRLLEKGYQLFLESKSKQAVPIFKQAALHFEPLGLPEATSSAKQLLDLVTRYNQVVENYTENPGRQMREAQWLAAGVHSSICALYDLLGNFEKALPVCLKSLDLAEKFQKPLLVQSNLSHIARLYGLFGDFDLSVQFYKRAILLSRQLGDDRTEALDLLGLADIYKRQSNLNEALGVLLNAKDLFLKAGDGRGVALSFNRLGLYSEDAKNFEDAREYLENSVNLYHALGDTQEECLSLESLGTVLVNSGHSQDGIHALEQAAVLAEDLHDSDLQRRLFVALGQAYSRAGDEAKAKAYKEKGSTSAPLAQKQETVFSLLDKGIALYNNADYTKAMQYLEKAAVAARQDKDAFAFGGMFGNLAGSAANFVMLSSEVESK